MELFSFGNTVSYLSSSNGEHVSTLQGEIKVDLSSFWDEFEDNINININIDKFRGIFGGKLFEIHVSYFYVNWDPDYVIQCLLSSLCISLSVYVVYII